MSMATLVTDASIYDDVQDHKAFTDLSKTIAGLSDEITMLQEKVANMRGEDGNDVEDSTKRNISLLRSTISGKNHSLQSNILRLDSMKKDMSLVHIYFKELGIVKYSRDELFSIIDVIGR